MARRPSSLRIDDPAWVLLQALISYWGVTDAAGAADGSTLVCSDLANQPDFNGNHVVIISGTYGGQARDINGTTLAGTVTPAAAFGGRIVASTIFAILPIRTTPAEVAALEAKLDLVIVPGVFTYLDAGGVQTIFTFTPGQNTKIGTIWFDLAALTQNTTIRLRHQIDGANYRTFETFNWTTGMDDGVYFRNIDVANGLLLQATMQEAADEGADRDIPYYYTYEPR